MEQKLDKAPDADDSRIAQHRDMQVKAVWIFLIGLIITALLVALSEYHIKFHQGTCDARDTGCWVENNRILCDNGVMNKCFY
jgi:hypothetical protein